MDFKKQLKTIKKALRQHPEEKPKASGGRAAEVYEPVCICRDRNGEFKNLYASEAEALKQAALLRQYNGAILKVYPCPDTPGWHLSSG